MKNYILVTTKKTPIIFFLIFIWIIPAWANRPTYNASRYLEDYSYLRDPAKRTDPFDSIKFIPLTELTYISLGGETRQHFEHVKNDNWGATPEDLNGYFLQRYMFHSDIHFGNQLRIFSQIKSGVESGRKGGPRAVDQNNLDLHQVFLDYSWDFVKMNNLTLRFGRQELFFGSRRWVNYRERPNVRLSFDGAKGVWKNKSWTISGFATKPVEVDQGEFDDDFINGQSFWGLYAVRKTPAWLFGNLDLYYLGLERDKASFVQGINNELRHSFGLRWWDKPGPWDYDFEFIYQFGKFGKGNIRAFTFASNSGYSLRFNNGHKFRLSLRGDISSGDDDPSDVDLGTFNLMFGKGKHLGQLAPYGPVNLYELHPKVNITLYEKYKIVAMWEFLWRQNLNDGIYSIANIPLRAENKSKARYVGNQAILEATWQVDRHLSITGLFGYFFAGTYLKETLPGEDIRYTSAMLVYKF